MKKTKKWPLLLIILLIFFSSLCGALLGKALAITQNTINTENFTEFTTALPTKLLDINGELITEFASDEKREIIALNRLPQHMIDALLTREDRIFYQHRGYSAKALFRAVIGIVSGSSLGGGSTLTQQIAGTLYCDRKEKSVKRKFKELWWAFQMERRYSKNEILELYLNKIFFGGGTYGVNAASKYYFGHGATQITPAEAAILVIQLSNPTHYNPFEHPNVARDMQSYILKEMVESGYISQQVADESFESYWSTFDYTRTSSSAYAMRQDEAPWFSEYVRRELNGMLYGDDDIYTGGYTVNTTLNLSHQKEAEQIMADYIVYANKTYQQSVSSSRMSYFKRYTRLSDLLTLAFNLPDLRVTEQRAETLAIKEYTEAANPVLDIMSMMCGIEDLKTQVITKGNVLIKQNAERNTVEGTMIALENSTGYIDAIVGGSKYDQSNQFIRAVQAKIQPGSSFKPLYYSSAIDAQVVTMTSVISDTPVVFQKADGTPYIPNNYGGAYRGNVQVWYALCQSLNIPALKILDMQGFDAAIDRTTSLLGIPQNEWESRSISPVYPLGLGVCSVRPIEMAKAYATIANNGKEVTPIAIRNIEDRDGNIKLNPEKELRDKQNALGEQLQIISPENAFIMQEMMKHTVSGGTLAAGSNFSSTLRKINKDKGTGYKFRFTAADGSRFNMPVAGKTGTTQNWADAWAIGFTPYYTAVFWYGFDRPGQSLGLAITGASLAAPAWGDFMNFANQGKPYKKFFDTIPEGIVSLTVCSESGGLLTEACGDHRIAAYYLKGTEPTEACKKHTNTTPQSIGKSRLEQEAVISGWAYQGNEEEDDLSVDLDFLEEKTEEDSDWFNSIFGSEDEGEEENDEDFNEEQDSFLFW